MQDKVCRILEGAVDAHLHASPCLSPRRQSILEVAQDAKRMNMKGFVLKDHHFSTAPHAKIYADIIPEVQICGGVVIGNSVGGLNPVAVESSLKMGGQVVWMPSIESAWMMEKMLVPGFDAIETYKRLGVDPQKGGISIFTEYGKSDILREEVREIIALIKQYNGVLESGHLSKAECYALVKEARQQGLRKIVITHANQTVTKYSADEQKELVSLGAFIMLTITQYMPRIGYGGADIAELGQLIREVGASHVVLGTDFGTYEKPPAMEGMRMMVANLVRMGFTEEELKPAVGGNAAEIYFNQ